MQIPFLSTRWNSATLSPAAVQPFVIALSTVVMFANNLICEFRLIAIMHFIHNFFTVIVDHTLLEYSIDPYSRESGKRSRRLLYTSTFFLLECNRRPQFPDNVITIGSREDWKYMYMIVLVTNSCSLHDGT